MQEAVIASVAAVATHDGEAALVVVLAHPGGGQSYVQMSGEDADEIDERDEKSNPGELVGLARTVLQNKASSFV